MRICSFLVTIFLPILLLVSCSSTSEITSAGASNPGYGPFDRNGDYVEEWADRPAKKHWWARKPQETPAPKEEPVLAAVSEKTNPIPKPVVRFARSTEVASLNRTASSTRRSAPASTYTPPRPKPVAYTPPSKPKPKPKPVPVKPKTPPPIRHLVAKGDTLYNLSRRYNTTVSKIQKANGIRGSTIRLGQTLLIPRI